MRNQDIVEFQRGALLGPFQISVQILQLLDHVIQHDAGVLRCLAMAEAFEPIEYLLLALDASLLLGHDPSGNGFVGAVDVWSHAD